MAAADEPPATRVDRVGAPTRRGFGMHLTLDLEQCDLEPLQDLRTTHDVMRDLVGQLRMTALTPPFSFHYDGGEHVEDEGITGFMVIAESHISIHTFPHRRFAFADVFSCQPFDVEVATRYLASAYGSRRPVAKVLDRGENFVWR